MRNGRIKSAAVIVTLYLLALGLLLVPLSLGCASKGAGTPDEVRRAEQYDAVRVEQTYTDLVNSLSDLRVAKRIGDADWDRVLAGIHVIGPRIDSLKAKAAVGLSPGWDDALAAVNASLAELVAIEAAAKR